MAAARPLTWHYLYIFHRDGTPVVYREWDRPSPRDDLEWKSLFGFLFTMRMFTAAIDPSPANGQAVPLGTPLPAGQGCGFHACATDTYKMNVLETPTGVKVLLVTEPTSRDLRDVVWSIYRDAYVPCVKRHHASDGDGGSSSPAGGGVHGHRLDGVLRALMAAGAS